MSAPPDQPVIHVLIGQVHVVRPPRSLFAVLGSCVGVALVDRSTRLAGMAHVLLPESRGQEEAGMPGKYADRAVDCLVETMRLMGARQADLVAFVAGGAAICADGDPHAGIGESNGAMTLRALRRHGVPIAERHLGGRLGRKVTLRTDQPRLVVEPLRATDATLAAAADRHDH